MLIESYLLEQFEAVARCGTLLKASEELHISQPSLSRSMKGNYSLSKVCFMRNIEVRRMQPIANVLIFAISGSPFPAQTICPDSGDPRAQRKQCSTP